MRVLIAGAGPAGALLACLLSQQKHSVVVYDKRTDPREDVRNQSYSDRYVGLLLTERGLAAVERIGLGLEAMKAYTSVVTGRRIHQHDSVTELDWGVGSYWHAIDRMELLSDIVNRAETQGADFTFNVGVESIDFPNGVATMTDGSQEHFDLIVGADGVNSVVRRQSGVSHEVVDLDVGYCWAEIPTGDLDTSRVNVWPHPEGIVHGLPSAKDTVNLTVVAKVNTLRQFTDDPVACREYCERHLQALLRIFPCLPEAVSSAAKGKFRKVLCSGLVNKVGNCVLIGDAAHSMAPFLGQGMNCSLEDAVVLADLICSHPLEEALQEFERCRKPEIDACHALVDQQETYFKRLVKCPLTQLRIKFHAWARWVSPWRVCPPIREMVNSRSYSYSEVLALQCKQNHWSCLGRVYE
eukprot:Sspe_Gene.7472::Locus_2530_Transcript_1_1_Confidence_1.000_Length_1738::g.7472::m.7472/K00486/KMO; kynurenine 3-monooxygenase